MRIGERIRELRRRDGRTQEALAGALGVTAQAVSRWEKGVCCPDVEMLPSIANYFNVSIDELFGYDNDRAKRVEALAGEIETLLNENNGVDVSISECIALARSSLIEFPGNERLTFLLASALFTAGYVRHGEHHTLDEAGYGVYDVSRHRTYPEWQEAVKLLEKLLPAMEDGPRKQAAVVMLSQLYKNLGEHNKALALAATAPTLDASRPLLRINAFDGREAAAACGEALLETVRSSAELMERIVLAEQHILPPAVAAEQLGNAVGLLALVCTYGNYGRLSAFAACLHMLRSYFLWRAGDKNGAFAALDESLGEAKRFDALADAGTQYFTAPLLRHVPIHAELVPRNSAFCRELPEVWPWWDVAERGRVKAEMEKDPRWAGWVARTEA